MDMNWLSVWLVMSLNPSLYAYPTNWDRGKRPPCDI
jgi:hypothetical protein